MKGVEIPPYEEDFTADPVELFFDLVFVFAFSRLVHHLIVHPDWPGIVEHQRVERRYGQTELPAEPATA